MGSLHEPGQRRVVPCQPSHRQQSRARATRPAIPSRPSLGIALLLVLLVGTLAGAAAAQACAGAGEVPNGANLARMRTATLCLLNRQRRRHGLHALRANGELAAAARYHAHDMISRRYFAHTSPSGDTIASRIRQTGYMIPRLRWIVGENLGWGTGMDATPAGMMSAWMHSPEHRANILYAPFRQVGIAVELGLPLAAPHGDPGVTYANEFGVRH